MFAHIFPLHLRYRLDHEDHTICRYNLMGTPDANLRSPLCRSPGFSFKQLWSDAGQNNSPSNNINLNRTKDKLKKPELMKMNTTAQPPVTVGW